MATDTDFGNTRSEQSSSVARVGLDYCRSPAVTLCKENRAAEGSGQSLSNACLKAIFQGQ